MSWTGSIQILENSPSRLQVVDPPYYFAGAMFVLVALGICAMSLIRDDSTTPPSRVGWPAFLIAVPFLVVAAAMLGSQTAITLDRSSNLLDIQIRKFFLPTQHRAEPLAHLRRAEVASYEGTQTLILLFASGSKLPLGSYTDRGGYPAAAEAINNFLSAPNPTILQ